MLRGYKSGAYYYNCGSPDLRKRLRKIKIPAVCLCITPARFHRKTNG